MPGVPKICRRVILPGKIIRYLSIGIVTTLVDWTLFYLLISIISIYYMLALAFSYMTSTVLSFFLNKHYTFRNTYRKAHIQLTVFVTVALIGLAISEAIVYSLTTYLWSNSTSGFLVISRAIATILVFLLTFALNNRITFKILN